MEIKTEKNFIKLGRSWGMIIPSWYMQILGINPAEDKMIVSIENDKIIIDKKK